MTSDGVIVDEGLLMRAARAVHLDVEPLPDGSWTVSGGSMMHVVGRDADGCDCADRAARGGPCKHQLAVRLSIGDRETLALLRLLIPYPSSRVTFRRRLP